MAPLEHLPGARVTDDVRFDADKIQALAPMLLNQLARLVAALVNEQRLGVAHSPATRLELGNAVALIMRTRADEQHETERKDITDGAGSDDPAGQGAGVRIPDQSLERRVRG
jgi:hypothetical protein